jgi:hypothetical protein
MILKSLNGWALGLGAATAALSLAGPASATIAVFTFQGTVASFIDTDNVYGFGVGANLAGDTVTDRYVIDTSYATFSSGETDGPGTAYNEYDGSSFGGQNSASSTIGGHTVTINLANGASLAAVSQQVYLGEGSPPFPYNQTILELQAIGFETTGTAIGSEFLFRDEVVTYSLQIPLSLTQGYSLTSAEITPGYNAGYSGIYFPYEPGATPADFDITSSGSTVPEPANWAMMLVGVGGLGAALRTARRRTEATISA